MSLPTNLFSAAFRRQRLGFLLTFILMLMVYLGSLAMAAQAVLVRTSLVWNADLSSRLTIEVPAVPDETQAMRTARAQSVAQIAARREGVAEAHVLPESETVRLLKPWITDTELLGSLPLPQLVDVRLASGAPLDQASLRAAVQEVASGAEIHAHAEWMDSLLGFVRGLGALAGVMLALTALALMAVISIVCNAAMAFQRETVELLHFMGATDRVIAGLFQRQILWLTLRGALTGFVGAAATLAILALMLGSLGGLALVQPVSWGMIAGVTALVPCAALVLAYVTARLSVMRLLRRML